MESRQVLEDDIVEFLQQEKLDGSYGIITKHYGKYRAITFCRPRITDGEIRVYGPKFFLLKWQTGIRSLPFNGQEKFTNVDSLKKFIKDYF